jgi:Na+/alanine symporter
MERIIPSARETGVAAGAIPRVVLGGIVIALVAKKAGCGEAAKTEGDTTADSPATDGGMRKIHFTIRVYYLIKNLL